MTTSQVKRFKELEKKPTAPESSFQFDAWQTYHRGKNKGKLLSPERRRACVNSVQEHLSVS
jgi:hypothetical protein